MTGAVRNDGTEAYEGIGILAAFFTADDGELRQHGPVEALVPCPFLQPGGECPFSVEIYARDYVAYTLHPEGQPLSFFMWHEGAPAVLSGLGVGRDAAGNVRITGVVVNRNEFPLKSVTIAGTLLGANGEIVSLGRTIVLGDIEPGGRGAFDLRIRYEPYYRYEVQIQAVRY